MLAYPKENWALIVKKFLLKIISELSGQIDKNHAKEELKDVKIKGETTETVKKDWIWKILGENSFKYALNYQKLY